MIKLGEDTEVLNMSDTSNRESNGDFEDSWTQYWMTFSNEETFKYSVCETLHVDGKDAGNGGTRERGDGYLFHRSVKHEYLIVS